MAIKGVLMQVSLLVWSVTVSLVALLIIIDLFTASRKPHDVKFKEAVLATLFYVGISIGFGCWFWGQYGSKFGTEFFAANLLE